MSCQCANDDGLQVDSNGCFQCIEVPKVKGRFGLAWVSESPECPCPEPVGWQVEFLDTPSKVEQKCQEMVRWINCPPLPRCDPCPPDELCSPCNPPRCNPCAPKCNPCLPKCGPKCSCKSSCKPKYEQKCSCCCKPSCRPKRGCFPPSGTPCCRPRSPRRRPPGGCTCNAPDSQKCTCDKPVKDTNNGIVSSSGTYSNDTQTQQYYNPCYSSKQVTPTEDKTKCICSKAMVTLYQNDGKNRNFTDTEYSHADPKGRQAENMDTNTKEQTSSTNHSLQKEDGVCRCDEEATDMQYNTCCADSRAKSNQQSPNQYEPECICDCDSTSASDHAIQGPKNLNLYRCKECAPDDRRFPKKDDQSDEVGTTGDGETRTSAANRSIDSQIIQDIHHSTALNQSKSRSHSHVENAGLGSQNAHKAIIVGSLHSAYSAASYFDGKPSLEEGVQTTADTDVEETTDVEEKMEEAHLQNKLDAQPMPSKSKALANPDKKGWLKPMLMRLCFKSRVEPEAETY